MTVATSNISSSSNIEMDTQKEATPSELGLEETNRLSPKNEHTVIHTDGSFHEHPEKSDEFGEVIEEEAEERNSASGCFKRFRQTCGNLVNNHWVQLYVIFLIILNAILMGVATFDFVTDDPKVQSKFEKADMAFLIVFTIELAMQLIYRSYTLFQDAWLTFDFVIVLVSWAFEGVQIIRAFRVFRVFRLITRVKILRDLVTAIGAVMPRLYAITALSILVIYIFGVLFTELFKDLRLSRNYFQTLDASLLTCVELMSLEWVNPVRQVLEIYDWAWAPFISYLMLMGFIMFNLILAVVCDAVAVVEKASKKEGKVEISIPDVFCTTHRRIDDLAGNVSTMLENQTEMQQMIKILASELAISEATPSQQKYGNKTSPPSSSL